MKFLDIFDTSKTARIFLNIFFVINTLIISVIAIFYGVLSFVRIIAVGFGGLVISIKMIYFTFLPFVILLLASIYSVISLILIVYKSLKKE